MGFGTICGFKHLLGVLECIPCEKRETTVSQLGIGSFQKVWGERAFLPCNQSEGERHLS